MIDDWEPFYRATADNPVRPLCLEAIATAGEPHDRLAVDLGAGAGRETAALLDAGWRVLALDGAPGAHLRIEAAVPPVRRDRLTVVEQSFSALDRLPDAGLVYAGYALPFQRPEVFARTWSPIRASLRPGAILAVNLFGPRDTWADDPELTTHSPAEARGLLDGLEVLALREEEREGVAVSGPKHWHVLDLLARA
ncbi:class I SAM-dependent methyltransferase [Streptacidiphilus anmyonensis]|uniref:class I SAM-dependent methyltransferase n=1 Tax=Streptacidiphilus anmyonensis TaxID=405782 RepID=UPI00191C2871|nr:methyltransferase domain-containing protein [Streptacidiphilus anmyonensis]